MPMNSELLMVPVRTDLFTGRELFTRESTSSSRCSWQAGENAQIHGRNVVERCDALVG